MCVCVCVAHCGGIGLDGRAALCPTHESKVDPWFHLIQRHLQPTQREGGGGREKGGRERGREGGRVTGGPERDTHHKINERQLP